MDRPVQVEIQPLRQLLELAEPGAVAERGERFKVRAAIHPFVQPELAGHVADPGMDGGCVRAGLQAEHRDAPRGRPQQVEHRADRRGLAGAVWPEVAEDLTCADVERQVDHAAACTVRLGEILGDDDVVTHLHATIVARRALPPYCQKSRLPRAFGAVEVRRVIYVWRQ